MKYAMISAGRGLGPGRTLLLASAACCLWVGLRVLQTGQMHYRLLWWNLFLAWMPLGFARAVEVAEQAGPSAMRRAGTWAAAVLWLLFFPNAPYLFTDLIHARRAPAGEYWVDFSLILGCAVAGWAAGLASLRLMHARVVSWWGPVVGWGFCSVACLAAGVGVYLGRDLRLHSWDVFLHPEGVWQALHQWLVQVGKHSEALGFPLGFAAFVGISYVAAHALMQRDPEGRPLDRLAGEGTVRSRDTDVATAGPLDPRPAGGRVQDSAPES